MRQTSFRENRLVRLLATTALIAAAATLSGCMGAGSNLASRSTGSAANSNASMNTAAPQAIDAYAARYKTHPGDAANALAYGQALRGQAQYAQASAVLEQASIANPGNTALLGAYGRALADTGNFQASFDTLSKAHTPDNPDWRILSAQGTALDQLGRHEEARRYYTSALKIVPDEPQVLSNLGMSYILTKNLPKAEEALRRASERPGTDTRIRQNYALVVGLQGRFQEAEKIASADVSPLEAAANVAYLRSMLSNQDKPAGKKSGRGDLVASGS